MNNLNKNLNGIAKLSEIRESYIALVDFIRDVMLENGIITKPSYVELSKKLGYTYNFIKDKKNSLRHHYPEKKTFDDLYNRLTERFKKQLMKFWDKIELKFIKVYDIAFSSNRKLPSMIKSPDLSIKRRFFNNIKKIIKKQFVNIRIFDTDISRIFYSKARALKDSHFKESRTHRRLTLSMLFAFIFSIRNLTTNELTDKIRDIKKIDNIKLEKIKYELEAFIEKFIFSNPYKTKYINDIYDIGAKYFKPEYDLTLSVWFELSNTNKKPILIKVARRIIKYSTFGRLDKFGKKGRGNHYTWDGLIQLTKQLTKLLSPSEYNIIIPKINQYIKIRNLHPIQPRIYHRSWYTKSTIKFHIILLIIRDLGLDILNLEPIEPLAFKKTNLMEIYTYERHHIFPNDKFSIDVNRLVLTMHKNHAKLERKKDLILRLIQSRIDLTLECPNYYKVRFSNWQSMWQKYLERRLYLLENGIESFITRYFTDTDGHNYIIERFFKSTPKGEMEAEIESMIHNWIKKKRPVPVLNPIIITRLVNGTLKLINNGYKIT